MSRGPLGITTGGANRNGRRNWLCVVHRRCFTLFATFILAEVLSAEAPGLLPGGVTGDAPPPPANRIRDLWKRIEKKLISSIPHRHYARRVLVLYVGDPFNCISAARLLQPLLMSTIYVCFELRFNIQKKTPSR